MENFLNKVSCELKNIFTRFRRKDFSGNTGQVLKNSSYQFTTNIIMKIGSLLFTIIVARLLMPELFGLYTLALSTILLFSAFADFGIGQAIITFVSSSLGKGDLSKAKAYTKTLLKWKFVLVILSSLILLGSSYFLSNNYYNKPIFYALLAGGLYIPVISFVAFFENIFKSTNNFRTSFIKEIILQVLRLTLVPLGILLLLRNVQSPQLIIAGVILILTFCYLVSLFFLVFSTKKVPFRKSKSEELSREEYSGLKKFMTPLTMMVLSGVFFGYIDTFMLGHFVSEEFIAYYGASFALAMSVVAIIGFMSVSTFPLLAKLKGNSLERLFKNSVRAAFVIVLFSSIGTYTLANLAVRIAYGNEYLTSVPLLKWFAILVLILPISSLFDAYLTSQKRTKVIAILLVATTILNIILNYICISYGLKFGEYYAILGAAIATIISRTVYLWGIILAKKRWTKSYKSF